MLDSASFNHEHLAMLEEIEEGASAHTKAPVMCDARDDDEPLRQGDMFRTHEETEPQTFGIIVTSDCDIAQDKAWSILTWVPLVPIASYAASAWAYDEVARLTKAAETDLSNGARKTREKKSLPAVSNEAIFAWARTGTFEDLCQMFGCREKSDADRLKQDHYPRLLAIQQAYHALEQVPPRYESWPHDAIDLIFKALGALKIAKESNYVLSSLAKKMGNDLSKHPGDTFVIYGLPNVAGLGHVALLRFVREIRAAQVAKQAGAARRDELNHYRFARLSSPYRYDLTRRLGAVFSDIGLPDHYDQHNKITAAVLAQTLVNGK